MNSRKRVSHISADITQSDREDFNLYPIYIRIGDSLKDLPATVQPGLLSPSDSLNQDTVLRLALVTAFQYVESLPDPIASVATFQRTDWKYALYLPAKHPGISADKFSTFRHNMYISPTGRLEFERLLAWLGDFGLYGGLNDHNPESVQVLQKICKITRFYRLFQTMKAGLGAIVSCDPNWLRVHILPHWYERYKTSRKLQFSPSDPKALEEEAVTLGEDISQLINTLKQQEVPEISFLPEIRRLTWLLEEEFINEGGNLIWRLPGTANCSCSLQADILQ